jgi:hypothetical protein
MTEYKALLAEAARRDHRRIGTVELHPRVLLIVGTRIIFFP